MIASLQSDYAAADDEDEEIDDLEALDKVSDSWDDLQHTKKKQKLQRDHEVSHKNTKQTQLNKEMQTLRTDKNNIFNWE